MASIEQRVKDIIVEQLGVEEEFNIEIPDEDAEGISTVKDAIDYIKANVKEV